MKEDNIPVSIHLVSSSSPDSSPSKNTTGYGGHFAVSSPIRGDAVFVILYSRNRLILYS